MFVNQLKFGGVNEMKKSCVLCVALFALCAFASTASASYVLSGEKVKVFDGAGDAGQSGSRSGGAFDLVVQNSTRSFRTFCLELNEFLTFDVVYDVSVSNEAVEGGIGGGSPDPISKATAYLFHKWQNDIAKGADVQLAIWYAEEEIGIASLTADALTLYNDAVAATAGDTEAYWWSMVGVANLLQGNTHKQSVLTRVPEPASVAVWGFIASVFGGGMYLRRRRNA
jgi:hypothetical protein